MKRSAALLCFLLCLTLLCPDASAAAPKMMTSDQAATLALATDYAYQKKQNEIILKQMQYKQAVASVNARWKRLDSFSWSPLFNFKFPQKPYADEEFELKTKAKLKDNEVKTLQHELSDLTYAISEKVRTVFCDVYLLQEKLAFSRSAESELKKNLTRNETRLSAGLAKQSDVDALRAALKAEQLSQAGIQRDFEAKKEKLSQLTGTAVSSGYQFINPLGTLRLDRSQLGDISSYTLANSHAMYQARGEYGIARSNLETYEGMLRSKYGGLISYISADLQRVKSGSFDVDYNAFKLRYDRMLEQMDKPWNGYFRILFIRIPYLWLKGRLDGTRYIENEPYGLYLCCMEYTDAAKALQLAEREVTEQVKSDFETLVTAANAYQSMTDATEADRKSLARLRELNLQGKADFTEVQDGLESYRQSQTDQLSALAAYTQSILSYDRLTCGAISKLRTGASLALDAGQGGDSYADIEDLSAPYYYISEPVTGELFAFGIHIPDDFELEITHYELWYDGLQVGPRTEKDAQIRHMPLVYKDGGMLTLRVYQGDAFLDEAELNPAAERGPIRFHPPEKAPPPVLGSYLITENPTLGVSTLSFQLEKQYLIRSYTLEDADGKPLFDGAPRPSSEGFSYLSFVLSDLAGLRVKFFGADEALLYSARFDVVKKQVAAEE